MTTVTNKIPPYTTKRVIFRDGSQTILRDVVSFEDVPDDTQAPAVTFHYVNCEKTPASIHRIQAVIEKCGSVRLKTWDGTEVVGVRYIPSDDSTDDDIILDDGSSFVDTWFLQRWYEEGNHVYRVARAVYGFWEPDIPGADGIFE